MDSFEVATSVPTVRRFLDRPISDTDIARVSEST
jgi:hypothetical protein